MFELARGNLNTVYAIISTESNDPLAGRAEGIDHNSDLSIFFSEFERPINCNTNISSLPQRTVLLKSGDLVSSCYQLKPPSGWIPNVCNLSWNNEPVFSQVASRCQEQSLQESCDTGHQEWKNCIQEILSCMLSTTCPLRTEYFGLLSTHLLNFSVELRSVRIGENSI